MTAGTISWAAQIAGIWAALEAFHIHVGLAGAGLVFVSSTIVQLFPFWPGNLGIFQLGVAGPLVSVYALSTANAVAFSVGLQLVEGLLGVGLGLFFLAREGLSLAAPANSPRARKTTSPSSPRTWTGNPASASRAGYSRRVNQFPVRRRRRFGIALAATALVAVFAAAAGHAATPLGSRAISGWTAV